MALNLPKTTKTQKEYQKTKARKELDYYAYGEDSIQNDFKFLPIYQVGNEFAAPYMPKKTILKEFDLLELY